MAIHLQAGNWPLTFPPYADAFPPLADKDHYFDAWLLNRIYQAIVNIEGYLITHKTTIEQE